MFALCCGRASGHFGRRTMKDTLQKNNISVCSPHVFVWFPGFGTKINMWPQKTIGFAPPPPADCVSIFAPFFIENNTYDLWQFLHISKYFAVCLRRAWNNVRFILLNLTIWQHTRAHLGPDILWSWKEHETNCATTVLLCIECWQFCPHILVPGVLSNFPSIFNFIRKLAAVPIFPSSPGKDTWTDSVPDVCNNCSFAVTWYVTMRYVWYVFRPKRRILERMVMQHVKTPTKFADWHNDQNTFKCHMLAYAQKVSLLNIKFVKKILFLRVQTHV